MTYPLLTLQQHSTYGIMHEHMNGWHSIKARKQTKTENKKQKKKKKP